MAVGTTDDMDSVLVVKSPAFEKLGEFFEWAARVQAQYDPEWVVAVVSHRTAADGMWRGSLNFGLPPVPGGVTLVS